MINSHIIISSKNISDYKTIRVRNEALKGLTMLGKIELPQENPSRAIKAKVRRCHIQRLIPLKFLILQLPGRPVFLKVGLVVFAQCIEFLLLRTELV